VRGYAQLMLEDRLALQRTAAKTSGFVLKIDETKFMRQLGHTRTSQTVLPRRDLNGHSSHTPDNRWGVWQDGVGGQRLRVSSSA
jgi:hypothetical protein